MLSHAESRLCSVTLRWGVSLFLGAAQADHPHRIPSCTNGAMKAHNMALTKIIRGFLETSHPEAPPTNSQKREGREHRIHVHNSSSPIQARHAPSLPACLAHQGHSSSFSFATWLTATPCLSSEFFVVAEDKNWRAADLC